MIIKATLEEKKRTKFTLNGEMPEEEGRKAGRQACSWCVQRTMTRST